jgi:threonine aldolase
VAGSPLVSTHLESAAPDTTAWDLGPAPERTFASDNAAGAHPEVLAAMAEANTGHAMAYGADRWTAEATDRLRALFGVPDAQVAFCFNGTGSNVVALQTLLGKHQCVVASQGAHIDVDETGAPERILGAKIISLPTPDGKLVPGQLEPLAHALGVKHHAQPHVVSVTQSTERGTLYSAEELKAVCDEAHRLGMVVHLDGARIANAAAALGGDLRSFTTEAGVDVVVFGGTKNGMVGGEAVVWLRPELATAWPYLQKQVTQLPSKMRFVAAQFLGLLTDDLWLRSAGHANAMAQRLADGLEGLAGQGVRLPHRPAVNGVFPCLPRPVIDPLQAWTPHYTWDEAIDQVRLMCSWDTTAEDVDRMVAGIGRALRYAAGS